MTPTPSPRRTLHVAGWTTALPAGWACTRSQPCFAVPCPHFRRRRPCREGCPYRGHEGQAPQTQARDEERSLSLLLSAVRLGSPGWLACGSPSSPSSPSPPRSFSCSPPFPPALLLGTIPIIAVLPHPRTLHAPRAATSTSEITPQGTCPCGCAVFALPRHPFPALAFIALPCFFVITPAPTPTSRRWPSQQTPKLPSLHCSRSGRAPDLRSRSRSGLPSRRGVRDPFCRAGDVKLASWLSMPSRVSPRLDFALVSFGHCSSGTG